MTFKLLFLKHFISLNAVTFGFKHKQKARNLKLAYGVAGVAAPCLPNQRAVFMKKLKSYSVIGPFWKGKSLFHQKVYNSMLWIPQLSVLVGSNGVPACRVGCWTFYDHQGTIWIVHILSVILCIRLGLIRKTILLHKVSGVWEVFQNSVL